MRINVDAKSTVCIITDQMEPIPLVTDRARVSRRLMNDEDKEEEGINVIVPTIS